MFLLKQQRAEITLRSLHHHDRREVEQSLEHLKALSLEQMLTDGTLRKFGGGASYPLYSARLTDDLRAILRVEGNNRIVVEDISPSNRVDARSAG